MPKALDPDLKAIIEKHGLKASEAVWDCHGTWVMYHWAVEQAAAKAGITFGAPTVIEASAANKVATILVPAVMGTRSEWSIGEAAPANNKNSYPFAMAEKRAKDRVALKLLGLAGLVYSEEEADDFKPANSPKPDKSPPGRSAVTVEIREHIREFNACADGDTLLAYINSNDFKKFAWRVCCDYEKDWLGPEDNSGLSGSLAQIGNQLGCGDDVQNYIKRMEAERLKRKQPQQQAAE